MRASREPYLVRADLREAHLEDASLAGAYLVRADLRKAHLERSDLAQAHLEGANLSSATGLTQAQIDAAYCDDKTILPPDLKCKKPVP